MLLLDRQPSSLHALICMQMTPRSRVVVRLQLKSFRTASLYASTMWPGGYDTTGSSSILEEQDSLVYIQSTPPYVTSVTNPIDAEVSMRTHVTNAVAACFALAAECSPFSSTLQIQSMASSLVLQRMDYGNAMLAGIPSNLINRMQSVMSSAARLCILRRGVTASCRSSHSCTG